jgi:N-acetylglucosaminyl-diphospho-decaprenol L-rhamnosyltransferase
VTSTDRAVPKVHVGIVSWNTATWLDRCLASLPGALAGLDAEVVVVDNASDDDSAEVAGRHDGVRVLRNGENTGYARAMNLALRGATAPVLIALNPDAEPGPGSLAALVERLTRHPDVGLVSPRLCNLDGTPQHSAYRFPSLRLAAAVCLLPAALQRGRIGRRWLLEGAPEPTGAADVDWTTGAVHCMRAVATGAQPYRERWFMYVEDLDLCFRLRQEGWRVVFDPDVTVGHAGNAAGSRAWGAGRDRRVLEASYDWYRLERGPVSVRAWAGVNAIGLAGRLAASALTGAGAWPAAESRRSRARALAALLRLHVRAMALGRV